jgi:hypothetical protein
LSSSWVVVENGVVSLWATTRFAIRTRRPGERKGCGNSPCRSAWDMPHQNRPASTRVFLMPSSLLNTSVRMARAAAVMTLHPDPEVHEEFVLSYTTNAYRRQRLLSAYRTFVIWYPRLQDWFAADLRERVGCLPYEMLTALWSGARREEIGRLSLECLDRYPDGTTRLHIPAAKTKRERIVPLTDSRESKHVTSVSGMANFFLSNTCFSGLCRQRALKSAWWMRKGKPLSPPIASVTRWGNNCRRIH